MDYALYAKSYDCVDVILDNFFAMNLEIEFMDSWEIQECISFQPNRLQILFENVIEKLDVGIHNIGFIKNKKNLMFIESETPVLDENRFDEVVVPKSKIKHKDHEHYDLSEDHCYPVVFKRLKIDLNLYPGSEDSWEFHKNLCKFYDDQKEIFKTDAVQKILKYMYKQNNWVLKTMSALVTLQYILFAIMT